MNRILKNVEISLPRLDQKTMDPDWSSFCCERNQGPLCEGLYGKGLIFPFQSASIRDLLTAMGMNMEGILPMLELKIRVAQPTP